MSSFHVAHAILIAIGAFYAFAGVVGIRSALQGRFMDIAIAAIAMKRPQPAETGRALWLGFASLGVLAGGVFLILRLDWAVEAFVVSALAQAVYLLAVAPLLFDRDDPPDAMGRQQTINAFILYSAATLFVIWAYRAGHLAPADAVTVWALWGGLGVLALAFAWLVFRFCFPMAALPFRGASSGGADDDISYDPAGDEAGPPLSESRRICVMAEYECDPLWTHDPGRSGTISPRDLPLSDALVADLEAWAVTYNGSFNFDDLAHPNWSEEQYAEHAEAGLALARRLKEELPDRRIYIWRHDDGHVEISPDTEPGR